jgi:hypothetical protein
MAFGLSGYTGRYSHQITTVSPDTLFAPKNTEDVAYRQWDIGADASIDIQSFRFRTEAAVERIEYDARKADLAFGMPGRYTPNQTLFGWYSIAAYRLPWLGLEPYTSYELYRYPTPLGEAITIPGVGLNVHFSTDVQLKTQITRTYFLDFTHAKDRSSESLTMVASRFVMAF